MRYYGPMISVGFFCTQFLHAFLFAMVYGPALLERYKDNPSIAYLWQLIGWILCFKVTYLYFRVSTTSPGVPSEELRKQKKGVKKNDDKLPINEHVA